MGNFSLEWIAEKFGVPTMFCFILLWAFYQAGTYTARAVVDPLVSAHRIFLDAERANMAIISDAVTKQAASMERQTHQMEQHTYLLERISKSSEEIKTDQKKFPAVAGAQR